jgi:cytoskeletal protein CcmA (bactofilin family)
MSKLPSPGQLTTLSSTTVITGDLTAENDIRIAGSLKGKLRTSGHLIVENTGTIEGEIVAANATIAGKIIGNIETHERLILESKAVFVGDIRTRLLVIEDGASFNGSCATDSSKRPDVKI